MSIAICTPWRDHPELEDDYFAAIDAGQPDQLVIVDDGSETPLPFAAVRLDEPSGFCTATNAGLRLVETDQVLFLNNDIRALRASWLDEFREGIEPGVLMGPIRHDQHCYVDGVEYPYVDGWALGMTTKDARSLNGWDVRYDRAGPAYFSDTWFSFQARLHGLRLRTPASPPGFRPGLHHKTGQTGGFGSAFDNAIRVNSALFVEDVRAALFAARIAREIN